jgi:hypothetical protein
VIVASMIVMEHRRQAICKRLGCLLGSTLPLVYVRLSATDLPAMVLILGRGVWLDYSIQTGREGVSYPATQFTLVMLITLVQGPARSRT